MGRCRIRANIGEDGRITVGKGLGFVAEGERVSGKGRD